VEQGTGNEGPIGICPGNTVNLQAIPYPPGASFPWGEPQWEIVEKSPGANAYLYYDWGTTNTVAGLNNFEEYVVVRARCGDFDTGDTITVTTQLENKTDWHLYDADWGSIPDECPPSGDGDGEDSYALDDCDNELEVSCCRSDGSGGDTGNAYRYFYNDSLISSCPWLYSPENMFYCKTATIVGTDKIVFTNMKHISFSYSWYHKWYEGCIGRYCTMIVIYDCITGSKGTYWRRSWTSPPQDIGEGEYCPGH